MKRLTPEQKSIIEEEKNWRKLYIDHHLSDASQIPLYDLHDDKLPFSLMLSELTSEEKRQPKILRQNWHPSNFGQRSILNQEEFVQKFKSFTSNSFDGMDWTNVVVAGGAVLANLMSDSTHHSNFDGSDIDLFFYGISDEDTANKKVLFIFYAPLP